MIRIDVRSVHRGYDVWVWCGCAEMFLREFLFEWNGEAVRRDCGEERNGDQRGEKTTPQSLLLTGGMKTGKTSFMYSLCCEHAQQSHQQNISQYSLIMTKQSEFQDRFPLFVHLSSSSPPQSSPSSSPSSDLTHRELYRYIQLSYQESLQDLIRHLSSLQFYQHPPGLVVIEDLSQILDPTMTLSRQSIEFLDQACRVLGHLFDACKVCGCREIVITDSCESSSEYLHLLQQFIPRHIQLTTTETHATNSQLLPSHSVDISLVSLTRPVSLGKSTLLLEEGTLEVVMSHQDGG
jgi:hypothetical protein